MFVLVDCSHGVAAIAGGGERNSLLAMQRDRSVEVLLQSQGEFMTRMWSKVRYVEQVLLWTLRWAACQQ